MDLIADILLAAAAIGAALYCFILGRRLNKFNSLETGVGGAVAVLSTQVEDLKSTLETAQQTAAASAETLTDLNVRAEEMSKRLELQMAALHDLPNVETGNRPINEANGKDGTDPSEPMFIRHAGGAA
jgi:hypothetical protein